MIVVLLIFIASALWGGATWIAYVTGHHGWAFIMLAAAALGVAGAAADKLGVDWRDW